MSPPAKPSNRHDVTYPPLNLFLGFRLYLILIKYQEGYWRGRKSIERILQEHPCGNIKGTSLYDVFGGHDLLVRAWLDPVQFQRLVGEIRNLDPSPDRGSDQGEPDQYALSAKTGKRR